jgi:hypothetical protein
MSSQSPKWELGEVLSSLDAKKESRSCSFVPVYFPGQMFGKPHMYLHGYARLLLRPVEPVGGEGEKVRYFKYIGVHPRYKLVELRPGDSAAWLHWSNGEVTNEGPHWNEEYIVETPQAFQRIDEAEAKELIRQLQPLSPPASSKPDLQEEIARLKQTIAEDDAKIARLEQQLVLAGECYRMTREMLEETWKQFNIARNKS